MSQDYRDLLYGLGSDDLNDFDFDLQDNTPDAAQSEDDYGEEDDAFFNNAITSLHNPTGTVGFSTAGGRNLPPPALSSLVQARKLLEDVIAEPSSASGDATLYMDHERTPVAKFSTAAGRRLPPPSREAQASVAGLFSDITDTNHYEQEIPPKRRKLDRARVDNVQPEATVRRPADGSFGSTTLSSPHGSGDVYDFADLPERSKYEPGSTSYPSFSTAAGKPMPPPSDTAMARVAHIFDETTTELGLDAPPRHSLSPTNAMYPSTPSFQTARGQPVPMPSKAAIEQAARLFHEVESDTLAYPLTMEMNSTRDTVGFPPPDSRSNVMENLRDPNEMLYPTSSYESARENPAVSNSGSQMESDAVLPETSQAPRRMNATPTNNRLYTIGHAESIATPVPMRPPQRSHESALHSPLSSSHRTPLRQKTNTFSASTITLPQPKSRPIEIEPEIKTPSFKRLGLAGTPATGRKRQKAFVTPFKDPQAARVQKMQTPIKTPQPKHDEAVFDLHKPLERKTMREAFLKPGYNSLEELEEMGLPNEIWTLDLSNAIYYQFIASDASKLDSEAALRVLLRGGCRLASAKWVNNHWSQILWKLAGQVQAQPSLFDIRWNWAEVIEQLKYRYEREIGSACRPILRRIQEHDSSAAVPMVLVVSAIHRPGYVESEGAKIAAKPFLELSDGWYRINAEIDDCLVRAVDKGRIAVGRKLAVCGSKLDSANDGEDVLDALDKSRLIVSGNSCNLARWDARLGLHLPFVAALSSLSVDGGIITLIDVEVTKIFPLAFVNVDKSSMEDPWNEAEEHRRQDQWNEKYRTESSRLIEEMRTRLAAAEELTTLLLNQAQDVENPSDLTPDNLDQEYDRLLSARNQTKMLSQTNDSRIVALATYASQRMQSEIQEGHNEVEETLKSVVPPRQVRDFRMVRVVDALQGNRDRFRSAMLTVWDARGSEIKEGSRYRVTSLFPGRQGDWAIPKDVAGGALREIYLHTRRETRWHHVA